MTRALTANPTCLVDWGADDSRPGVHWKTAGQTILALTSSRNRSSEDNIHTSMYNHKMGEQIRTSPRTPDGEQTRRRLLEAGWQLLKETPASNALSHVTAPTVSELAGVTKGAFYYNWSTQREYLEDLLDFALAVERNTSLDRVFEAAEDLAGSEVSFVEAIRDLCRVDLEAADDDVALDVQVALWGKRRTDPGVRDRLRDLYQHLNSRSVLLLKALAESQNLEPRPPYDYEKMAVVLTALLEGLALQRGVDHRVDLETYGQVVLSLLPAMTRHRGSEEELDAVIETFVSGAGE